MKELLEAIIRSLVDEPEEVYVRAVNGDATTILELTVAPNDIGKVVGRQGRMAEALRTLLASVSGRERRRYVLEIVGEREGVGRCQKGS